jgi:hypothetical protein
VTFADGMQQCRRCDGQRAILQRVLDHLTSKRRLDSATRERLAGDVRGYLVLGPDEVLGHAFSDCAGPRCDTLFWLSSCSGACHFRFVGGLVCGLAPQFHVRTEAAS